MEKLLPKRDLSQTAQVCISEIRMLHYCTSLIRNTQSCMGRFRPDCIFLSAGFDAHKKDTINAGYIALVFFTVSYL